MLSALIGNFDISSAFALLVLVAGPTLVLITYIARKPTKLEFMKAQTENDIALIQANQQREIEIKKLEQNLITSHKSNDK
ncbi:MAG: hypothetical protein KGI58_03925 [Patescibacteria group bacterium]|nr:hypothetical protein [Patescibacteria group bacterium]